MDGLSLADKNLLWQIKFMNTKNNIKERVSDALFRREEGSGLVQAAILVAFAVAAAAALWPLVGKITATFTRAGNELDRY